MVCWIVWYNALRKHIFIQAWQLHGLHFFINNCNWGLLSPTFYLVNWSYPLHKFLIDEIALESFYPSPITHTFLCATCKYNGTAPTQSQVSAEDIEMPSYDTCMAAVSSTHSTGHLCRNSLQHSNHPGASHITQQTTVHSHHYECDTFLIGRH